MEALLTTPRIERAGLVALASILRTASCRRVLVISGPGARHAERLERELAEFERQIFAEARRHVPTELVERASGVLGAFDADAVVTIGGGSATGLGKALRLQRQFFFVAVPTTYAASELTDLFGMTSAGGKRTGRDPRVVPDVALYDVDLMLDMPIGLSVTSLLNAFAHPASALSTGKLDAQGAERALAAAASVYSALQHLGADPRSLAGRQAAIDGTLRAGVVLRTSAVGLHHEVAHALGGRFDLDHAGLHGALLPHSVAGLAGLAPAALEALQSRVGDARLPHTLQAFLRSAGAPVSLAELGVTRAGLDQLLAERPHLPREWLERAFAGDEPRP
ncbi:MAG TPA: iron-containing alcohol dehydrogenase [Polyangiaceae bacterium]|nr:iron-containing alcohol dehydrogenase [Polyangiaceae bacterium]